MLLDLTAFVFFSVTPSSRGGGLNIEIYALNDLYMHQSVFAFVWGFYLFIFIYFVYILYIYIYLFLHLVCGLFILSKVNMTYLVRSSQLLMGQIKWFEAELKWVLKTITGFMSFNYFVNYCLKMMYKHTPTFGCILTTSLLQPKTNSGIKLAECLTTLTKLIELN